MKCDLQTELSVLSNVRMTVSRLLPVVGLACFALGGCFGKTTKEPVEVVSEKPQPKAGGKAKEPAAPPKGKPLPPDPCTVLDKIGGEPPIFVPGQNVMVTKLLKPCITREGLRGYDKESPWIAMGFPCTGGGGRVSTSGSYYAPKVVTFIVSTDCPMRPSNLDDVAKAVREAVGLNEKMRLMAFNSFAVQYWEVPGLPDADTGFTVELFSPGATEGAWKRLRQKEPLRVHLYGRENSWTADDRLYRVEADIKLTADRVFEIDVVGATLLTDEERQAAKERCEKLRPPRGCVQYFN